MESTNFLVSILLCFGTYLSSAEELSCHMHGDDSYDGQISVTYDRDELSIYKYNDTKFVNFLLRDIQIKFDGVFPKENEVSAHIVGIETDVEGIAKLQKNEKESMLTACHFNLKKNVRVVDNVNLSSQVQIIELAHTCIKYKLCLSLGSVQRDDYIRAKIDRYDFGENSVMFDLFAEKYPNLNLPSATGNNLQHTINLLADFWLASLITQITNSQLGVIKLPDVNETIPGVSFINQGFFKVNDGIFGGLRNFTRSKDIIIHHKGLEFFFEAEFKVPEPHIHIAKYALKYGFVETYGSIDIKINGVTFYVKASINYNRSPCEMPVPEINTEIGEVSFKLSQNGVFDTVINEATMNVVNRYIPNIVSLIKTKIIGAIKEPLEKFSCENFRP